jgi:hypothetical protein
MFTRLLRVLLAAPLAVVPIVGLTGIAHAASGGGCTTDYPSLQVCISEDSNYLIVPDAYANIYEPGGCTLEIDLYDNGHWVTGRSGLPCVGHSQGFAVNAVPGHQYQTFAHTGDWYAAVWGPVQTA